MSDRGNMVGGGWGADLMKLDEDIDLDGLLLDPVLFVFVLSSFRFFSGGGSLLGVSEYKKYTHMRSNFRVT